MSTTFPSPLTKQEEAYYVAKLEEGSRGIVDGKVVDEQLAKQTAEARNILIEHNLRLVAHIAKKYVSTGTGQDDLISIGTIGLIKAVNTYSGSRSTRLATYAARCIENEILMNIRSSKRLKQEVSLSLPIGVDKDGNEISLDDILGTDPDEIIDSIDLKIRVRKLYEAVRTVLSPREQTVIISRYGLGGNEPQPQREVAAELGISRSYISRIEKKALQKLRDYLETAENP